MIFELFAPSSNISSRLLLSISLFSYSCCINRQVLTRYRLRNEGDAVESDDYIVLRNSLFKDKYLTSIPPPASSISLSIKQNHLIGLRRDDAFFKLGWKIRVMRPYNAMKSATKDASSQEDGDGPSKVLLSRAIDIEGGMFVRMAHLESNGHFIARYDDSHLLTANMAPLGQFCKQILDSPSHNVGIFVRGHSVENDPNSAMSVWQILPSQLNKLGRFYNGDSIRFRHVLTGQYLCIRQVNEEKDSISIRTRSVLKAPCVDGSKPPPTPTLRRTRSNSDLSKYGGEDLLTTDWTVATTPDADFSTLFHILTSDSITDTKEDFAVAGSSPINNQSDVFFMHEDTHLILEEKKKKSSTSKREKKRNNSKKDKLKWEDYNDDIHIRPSRFNDSNVAVLREVYNIEPVSDIEAADVIYISKFIPILKSAIVTMQHTKKMSELFLPLFRHLNVATHTLVSWIMNQNDSDHTLLLHPALTFDPSQQVDNTDPDDVNETEELNELQKSFEEYDVDNIRFEYQSVSENSNIQHDDVDIFDDEESANRSVFSSFQEHINYSISSLGPWIGRGMSPFKKSAIVNPIHSSRNPTFSDFNTKRQNIVSDSRLLDLMVLFTTLVFRLIKDQVLHIDKQEDQVIHSKRSADELKAMYHVPSMLTGTCILVHDLVHSAVFENRRNSVRILSVKGSLLGMMDQEILGWNPPIGTLLIALQSTKRGTVQHRSIFDPTMVLDDQNIQNLIKKTYELYMTNNESAVNLIKLLTTLCSPGHIPNPVFQSLVLKAIFSTEMEDDVEEAPPTDGTETVSNLFHSLLFSTRKVNGAAWQVKFKIPFKVVSYHTSQNVVKRSIVDELKSLISMINPQARDGRLNITEVREFLTTLGLGGYSLYEESNFLEYSDFHQVMEWFWKKRSHFFPSSRTTLNELTYEEVKGMIDVDVVMARCAGVNVTRSADLSMGYDDNFDDNLDDDMASESDSGEESEDENWNDAQNALNAARNRANSLTNQIKREAAVTHAEGESGGPSSRFKSGGVFSRLFQRVQQQSNLSDVSSEAETLVDTVPIKKTDKTPTPISAPPKRGFFGKKKTVDGKSGPPVKQMSVRDLLRKESKDKILSLSPYEEFCEFREHVLSKIPVFDVGSYHDIHDEDHDVKNKKEARNNYGGIVKKGLSMFLLYSTDQAMKTMKKKMNKKKGRLLPWEGLFQVLGHSSFERDWFRESMIMMAELCRGENLQAQTLVNQLFPASMVLDMLSFGGENSDRLAVVTLLQNLYVVHDLVFPVAATCGVKRRGNNNGSGNGSGIICSLNEGQSSVMFNDAGKVFNDMTRAPQNINEGSPSSKVLRKMLWRNLSQEVNEIDLNSRDNEVLSYHTCLLTLLRELICKGFFVESADFEAEHKRMKEKSRSSNVKMIDKNEKKSFFSCFGDITTKSLSFNENDIEKVLIRKITTMVDNNKNDIDSVQAGLLKTLDNWKSVNKISEDEHANIRQKLIKNSNPVTVGSEHINIVNDYFTDNFSNSIKIMLVEEVISILDLIYDSHQLIAVKKILKILNNSEKFFTADVLHSDADVMDHPIRFTGVQSTIKQLFVTSRDHEAMYTDSMLALTLFNSDKVKSCAYDLLYKNVSKKMNAHEIISNLQILVCPFKASNLRLFQRFQFVARKFAHQMISDSKSKQFDYRKYISFAMNATKSLCYHTFHEKSAVSLINISRPGSIGFLAGNLLEIPLFGNSKFSSGADDDEGIEMVGNSGEKYSKAIKTDSANSSLLAVTAKFKGYFNRLVEDTASDVSREMLSVYITDINNLVTSRAHKGTPLWNSLSSDHQFILDAMLDICATICVRRPPLVIELLVNISKVAISYVWDCAGASRVTELLCEYCDVSGMIEEGPFMSSLESIFLSSTGSGKPNANVIRLIHAVLASNRDTSFARHCHSFVDKHLLRNGSMRKYILLDMPNPTPTDIAFHFQILRMFATFAKMSGKSTLLKMKACLSLKFCRQLLSSCCPLQIKMCVITFCVKIYNSNEIALLSYIKMDLENILSTVEQTESESVASSASTGVGIAASAGLSTSAAQPPVPPPVPAAYRFDTIRNPLLDYLAAVANVIVNTAIEDFLVESNDIDIIKTSINNEIRNKSFLSVLKSKKVVVFGYIEKKVVSVFEKEGIDSKKLTQFFEVIMPFYNILKCPCMSSFRDFLFAKADGFESIYSMFVSGYLMMCGLTKSKDAETYTKETMIQKDLKVNPNIVFKSHLEAMLLTLSNRRMEQENSECREHFLLLDGIGLYNQQVSRLLYEDSSQALNSNKKYDMASFVQSLDYSHELSSKFIQQTTFFQVLQKHLNNSTQFMENGGKELIRGTLINETSTLKRTSDFEKWIMCGGSYFQSMGSYMQNFSRPTSVNFFLLHALCELLDNDIDEIRASDKTTKAKIKLMGKEVTRLQKFQDTFENLGICDLVLAVVGRSLEDSLDDPFVYEFVPLALKVGFSMLASGNDSVQESLILSYKNDHTSGMVGSHKKHFMESLRKILRGATLRIDNFVKVISSGGKSGGKHFSFPIRIFKLLIKIFDFCGSLCSGHNDESRNFLRDQDHVGDPVDIVFDIAKTVNSLLLMLVSQMRYITFDHFYELLAPPVWPYYPDIKRRFIKWHDPRVDYDFVCQIFAALSSGFNALTEISQGPCFKNQPSALVATPYCQELLEYVGAMQLKAKMNSPGSKSFFDSKSVIWDGRHPLSFNKTYKHELKKLGRFRDDPDYNLIIDQINSLSENSKETKKFNSRMKLLTLMAQDVEQSCLRFLLALLEATSPLVSETLVSQLNDGILLQNMENQYKLSFECKGKLKKFRSEVTVSYLTLISIMASAMREDPNAMLDDFLLQWKQDNAAQGYNTEKLVASIEVTSEDGSVQRVYFAIPAFVTRYWAYPEVQKAKDKFLWAVSRESPEDKLSDFYDRSESLIQVMRRQEALRHILTPLVHGIFGGVNFLVEKIVILQYFKMQPIFLILSCCFNLANMYWQYRQQYPWIVEEEYGFFKEMVEFEQRDQYIFYVYCVHFALAAALFIRAFLNSPAADNFKTVTIFGRKNIVDKIVNGIAKLTLTIVDSWWPICLMAFSAGGILINAYFFAPILLDLINQIRLMSFLLEAITRNLSRIAYTLLLAIIFLYLFAVITIVGFEDQYALAGKSACKDLISCFKLQIDYGLVNPPEWVGDGYIDPWISADAEETSYGHIASIIAGSVFNFSYIILINLVLQAIISGLIIDTFSEMRAESEEIEVDIREKCFICSIERDEFEQLDIPFVEHTKTEHNMWQYIWFMNQIKGW